MYSEFLECHLDECMPTLHLLLKPLMPRRLFQRTLRLRASSFPKILLFYMYQGVWREYVSQMMECSIGIEICALYETNFVPVLRLSYYYNSYI